MRRKVNVKFLGFLVLTVVLLGGGVHLVHALQVRSNASGLRRQAELAQEEGRTQDAIRYLERFLGYVPDDAEAQAQLGLALEKEARTPKAWVRVFKVFEEVLKKDPTRRDIRERQARLAMELGRGDVGRFNDAVYHLEILLQEPSGKQGEWEDLLARCYDVKGEYAKAVSYFEKAIGHAPQQVPSYVGLAQVLRERLKQPERADKILDDMVRANDQSHVAHLARALERLKAGAKEDAKEDVNKAFQLAPGDLDVLLLSAELAQSSGKLDEARSYLQRALERHPKTPRVYVNLAEVELQSGRRPEALARLREGLKVLPDQYELVQALATVLIEGGEVAEASEIITQLRKRSPALAIWLDHLEARILIQKGDWGQATRILERIRPQLTAIPDLARRVELMLASCYEQRGEVDRQVAAYRRALTVDPLWTPARLGLAAALATQGKIDESLAEYRQILGRVPSAGVQVVRLLIARNLRLAPAARNWQEAEQLLDRAAKANPNGPELAILRADLLLAQGQLPQARRLLEKACDQQPDRLDLWLALASVMGQEKPEKLLETLAGAERRLGDRVELRLARARYWSRQPQAEATAALAKLEENLDKLTPEEQARLRLGLGEAQLRVGNIKEAERLWTQVAQQQKGDVRVRLLLFDLALQAGQEATVKRLVEEIRQLEGEDGLLWRYGEASRLTLAARRGDKQGLAEARNLLIKVRAGRPNWPAGILREAEIQELEGNPDRALENYLRTIELGDQNPRVVRRAVQLLYERRRVDTIQQLIAKLPAQSFASVETQRILSRVFVDARNSEQALAAAKAAAAGSKDYRDHVWLGQVLQAAGQLAEAEAALRRAVQLAEQQPGPWVVLVQHLVRTGQAQKATAALEEAQRKLPPDLAPLALGQCFEATGNLARAEENYRKALTTRPEDVSLLRNLAAFYQRHGQHRLAAPHLRKILDAKDKASAEEAAWARRTLAIGLVTGGSYENYREAVALVEENIQAKPGVVDDQRAKAIVLAAQHGSRREALRLLEDLLSRRLASPDDQFLLAQLHEANRDWSKARERMLSLLTSAQGENPLFLAYYIQTLLRHDMAAEAQIWVDKLQKLEPRALRTAGLKARVLKELGKGSEAVAFVKAYAQNKDVPVEAVAALYEELGQIPAAEELYRRYVSQATRPESAFVLAEFLARQNRIGEGLDLCEKAAQKASPEAVAVAGLTLLRLGTPRPEDYQRVERWLLAVIDKNPKDVLPVVTLGDLRYLQGQFAEAESLYRQVITRDPKSVAALNNLAWMLAVKEGKGEEALELVKRAVEAGGPQPALLDTRGVIYLSMGLTDLAVNDLEEAAVATPSATRYFHLAQAYQKAKNRTAALNNWRKAKAAGLKAEAVDPLERPAFQRLQAELEPK
jgi:tetratricopeptide (TPR) repeat protein